MPVTSPEARTDDHAVHLRLVQPWAGDPARARASLGDGGAEWLGTPLDRPADRPHVRRFESDLVLPMREQARHMVLRKAALVDLGPVEAIPGGFRVDVSWRSANLAPLFPVFVGTLTVLEGELTLDGYYAPPGGEIGVILDRALLNIAARGTARWFLSKVAEALANTDPGR